MTNLRHPDPEKHLYISLTKSFIRIVGYGLILINIPAAVGILVLSEIIGVIEELV